jgi:hypothetical protein
MTLSRRWPQASGVSSSVIGPDLEDVVGGKIAVERASASWSEGVKRGSAKFGFGVNITVILSAIISLVKLG